MSDTDPIEVTEDIPDVFIFCPRIQDQCVTRTRHHISENEMSQMEETGSSILHKFVTIQFDTEDTLKSKSQAEKDCLHDLLQNEATYENAQMYVSGIFSYEKGAPIDNPLKNSVQNLSIQENFERTECKYWKSMQTKIGRCYIHS